MKKLFLNSIWMLALLTVCFTACEEEVIIVDELDRFAPLVENTSDLEETGLEERMCPDFINQVQGGLGGLLQAIANLSDGISSGEVQAFTDAINNYRLDVLESCLPQAVVVPVYNPFIERDCFSIGRGANDSGLPCPEYAIMALSRFNCYLADWRDNPTNRNRQNLCVVIGDYVTTLNTCFDAGFEESDFPSLSTLCYDVNVRIRN